MTGTYEYIPAGFRTREELERWADENDREIVMAERGPDGLIRGTVKRPEK